MLKCFLGGLLILLSLPFFAGLIWYDFSVGDSGRPSFLDIFKLGTWLRLVFLIPAGALSCFGFSLFKSGREELGKPPKP